MTRRRVAVVCLDGMDSSLADQLLVRGELPNLAALRSRSASFRTVNPRLYRAEGPWLDFLTGQTVESRRFWSSIAFDPRTYGCSQRGSTSRPFYAYGPDRAVIALDVPKMVPAQGVRGVQVVGWGAHDAGHPPSSLPPDLFATLVREVGEHPAAEIEYDGAWHQPAFLARFAHEAAIGVNRRVECLRRLCTDQPDWDVLVVAMSEAHSAGHQMWHGVDAGSLYAGAPSAAAAREGLISVYRAIDDAVGEIVALVPPETTVVAVAPLGMERGDSEIAAMALLPELLHRKFGGEPRLRSPGFAAWRRAGCPPAALAEHDHFAAFMARRFGRTARQACRLSFYESSRSHLPLGLSSRVPTLAALCRRLVDRPRGFDAPNARPSIDGGRDDGDTSVYDWSVATWYSDEWPRVPAFVVPSFSDAQVRVNLEGRERDGIVPLSEYRTVCGEIERFLEGCRDVRTGRSAVAAVTRPRFDDPMEPGGPNPDLVVEFVDEVDAIDHPETGAVGPFPPLRTGGHDAEGFAMVAGPGITAGNLGTRRLVDVTATICALVGCPPPPGCDGTVVPMRG